MVLRAKTDTREDADTRKQVIIMPDRMLPSRPLLPLCWPSRLGQTRRPGRTRLAERMPPAEWTGLARRTALLLLCAAPLCTAARADGLMCPSEPPSLASPLKETPPSLASGFDISSDRFSLGKNGNLVLQGHVVVRQGDRQIAADEAHYDRATNSLSVNGSITYRDPLVQLAGSAGKYSPTAGAEVKGASFDLRSRPGHGSAQQLDLTPKGILDLKGVTFTTCQKPDESWQLKASSLKLDTAKQVGTGRDASIDFEGVPILYLPWLSFPLSNARKSGFLFPSVGNSSLSGIELQVPYYWNIAPNADLTFSPMYYSRRGVDLAGQARFLTQSQSGDIDWHYLPDDTLAGSGRSFVTLDDTAYLPEDLRVRVSAADVSDPKYFEDFGTGPESTSTAFLQRLIEITYRDENWNVGAEAQQYQPVAVDLQVPGEYLPEEYRPYSLAPRLYADGNFGWGPDQIVRYGFDSEVVDFTRAVGVTGWRLNLKPTVGLDFEDPGYFLRSTLAWDLTQYELDSALAGTDRSPSRSVPSASFDTGLRFDRLLGAGGAKTLTLEPRVLYLYVPYRNQESLPLFDTALPDLNLVELFRTNRYVGLDRLSDANQVTAGLTTRLLDTQSGKQYLTATLGQTYYIDAPRVELPGESLDGRRDSDLVGEVVLSAYQNWNASLNVEWNPAESQVERTFAQLQYKPGPESVVNVVYRYQRNVVLPSALATPDETPIIPGDLDLPAEPGSSLAAAESLGSTVGQSLDQAEISGAWPIGDHWHVLARWVYDLDSHSSLDRLAGFEYRACCWRIRLLARRYLINGTGQQDTAFIFQLQLSGLGGVGPATDAFLGSAIRGYSPPSSSR
ncbi:MAG: LPS-assembly protein LptD [Steroidobacteraceae bacterium]